MATTIAYKDLKPGQHWFSSTEGMRGWFACEFWMNNEDGDDNTFPEPYQSDPNSFATKAEANTFALILAELEDLPYVE